MSRLWEQVALVRVLLFCLLFIFVSSGLAIAATGPYGDTNVTNSIHVIKSRMMFNRLTSQNYLDISVENISDDLLLTPMIVVIDSISSADVTVANADGTTADGKPYFCYPGIAPNSTTASKRIYFNNPNRERFSFNIECFSEVYSLLTNGNNTTVETVQKENSNSQSEVIKIIGDSGTTLIDREIYNNYIVYTIIFQQENSVLCSGHTTIETTKGNVLITYPVSDPTVMSETANTLLSNGSIKCIGTKVNTNWYAQFPSALIDPWDDDVDAVSFNGVTVYPNIIMKDPLIGWHFNSTPSGWELTKNEGTIIISPYKVNAFDQNVQTGSVVTLDSGDYYVSYFWMITSKPAGSTATLSNSTAAKPYFFADVDGTYKISLVVYDGESYSQPTTVTITASSPAFANSPWPEFGRNNQRTGLNSADISACTLKWRYPTGGAVASSPAIGSDGTVYVGSYDGNLYAINSDGTLKWSYKTGAGISGAGIYSSPVIGSDGTVYVGADDGDLYAINPDGTLKWRYPTGSIIDSSPAIGSDGTIYVGSDDDNLYAINPDGTLKWSYPTGDAVASSPAIGSDGTVYVGSYDGNLYAINSDGTLKWSYQTGAYIDSSPAIGSDGTVYVGSADGNLYAINPDGTFKWSYRTGGEVLSSPAIGFDGTVYVGSDDDNLYAINPDGTLKWRYQTGDWIQSSPVIGSDGTVYVGSIDCNLYAIDPDGTLKWSYQTGNFQTNGHIVSSPALGTDGTVYVGSDNGYLYAICASS